jgi:Protein-tyrosine-phosphatase-like, N-terminal domain
MAVSRPQDLKAQIDAAVERLTVTFHDSVSRETITAIVEESAQDWFNARVKTFIPLLAERKAKRRIREQLHLEPAS